MSSIRVLGVSMLVMYFCVRGIDVGHVFVCWEYRFWSCICVLGVSKLAMYLCARDIDVDHVFLC